MTTIPGATRDGTVGVIQAVPTTYGGVRFRSRLEARWAFILDRYCRGQWAYEPQTFGWSDRVYLPDFRIRTVLWPDIWIEVKPMVTWEMTNPQVLEHLIPGGRVSAETGSTFIAVFGLPGSEDWTWTGWPNEEAQIVLPWISPERTRCGIEILNPSWSGESYGESSWGPRCGRCVECCGRVAARMRFNDGTHTLTTGGTQKRGRRP